jgi:oxygen-independent coproporphyrinogen-3 oxidase
LGKEHYNNKAVLTNTSEHPGGIYIHIPFCVKKCLYCDFYSITDLSIANDFLHAIQAEIRLRKNTNYTFNTIYIGGGTPSSLKPAKIQTILETVFSSFDILPGAEVTMEVNPGTVDLSDLTAYQEIGINRLSIGIQSFSETNLQFLGRIHSSEDSIKTIMAARKAKFSNISLDLIYGLPGQTRESWITDLQQAITFNPEHLSCYMLTYEPGTPLYRNRQEHLFTPLGEKQAGDLFSTTQHVLKQHGYIQYEISNFGKSKYLYSMHNRKYWQFHPYIGIGPSAHSFSKNTRSWNHRSVTEYIDDIKQKKLPIKNTEILDKEQQIIEFIYLGLRQTEGISMDEFNKRFGNQFTRVFSHTIKILKEKQLIQTQNNRCFLTPDGMLFLDSIADMFVNNEFS